MGFEFSVGMVGFCSVFFVIQFMRDELLDDIYMWINVFKDKFNYYELEEVVYLWLIDLLFEGNLWDYESYGKGCVVGLEVFYVQGLGYVKRCYKDCWIIGYLYCDGLEKLFVDWFCRMKKCGCYIGYVYMMDFLFREIYGCGLFE